MTAGWIAGVVAWLAVYELGHRRLRASGREWRSWRRACWWASAVLLALAGLPPLAPTVASAVWGESLQFALLAFGAAPLAVLAAPAEPVAALWGGRPRPAAPVPATGGWWALGAFLVATVGWRVPAAVDAVAGDGSWVALEAVTLVAGTWWLWAALMGSPPRLPVAPPARRIVLSAFAAWSVWVFAYAVGFTAHAFYPAYGAGVTPVSSQEWVVAILWVTSAAALLPVAFLGLVRWLSTEQALAAAEEADYRRLRARLVGGREAPRRSA